MNQIMACLECRQVFDVSPETCPKCAGRIFVQLNEDENHHSVCDELLFLAGLARNGFPAFAASGRQDSEKSWRYSDRSSARPIPPGGTGENSLNRRQ